MDFVQRQELVEQDDCSEQCVREMLHGRHHHNTGVDATLKVNFSQATESTFAFLYIDYDKPYNTGDCTL